MKTFFKELKKRNIYKVGVGYLAAGFVILQVADLTFGKLNLPAWSMTLLIILVFAGFPLALIFTWAFELTPEGIKKSSADSTHASGWFYGLIGVLVLGGTLYFTWPFSNSNGKTSPPGNRVHSIAVFPFNNLSNAENDDAFTNGMVEILNTNLARVEGFRAISRNSVAHYLQNYSLPRMVDELGLDYLIEGSVQLFEDQVRINIQLMDARTSEYVWANSYEEYLGDALILQKKMARDILQKIKNALGEDDEITLNVAASRVHPEALKLYLQGVEKVQERDPNDFIEAIDLFNSSIDIDSSFSPVYAQLAFSYTFLAIGGLTIPDNSTPIFQKARQTIDKALELNPNSSMVYVPMGLLNQFNFEWERAENNFRKAIAINPSHAEAHHELGQLLMRLERFDEALESAQRAIQFAPGSPLIQSGLGEIYLFKRDYQHALIELEKALELEPGRDATELWLSTAHMYSDNFQKALEFAEKANADRLHYAHIYARMGQTDKANSILEDVPHSDVNRAADSWANILDRVMVNAAIDKKESALRLLEEAIEAHTGGFGSIYLKVEPGYDPLRRDPRFQAIEQELFN